MSLHGHLDTNGGRSIKFANIDTPKTVGGVVGKVLKSLDRLNQDAKRTA
jgi:hypothetical protein